MGDGADYGDALSALEATNAEQAKRIEELEEGVSWSTSCLNCARMLTECHEETCAKEEAEEERDKLRVAWDKYGQHTEDCESYFSGPRVCDCKYIQARDAIEAALGEGG